MSFSSVMIASFNSAAHSAKSCRLSQSRRSKRMRSVPLAVLRFRAPLLKTERRPRYRSAIWRSTQSDASQPPRPLAQEPIDNLEPHSLTLESDFFESYSEEEERPDVSSEIDSLPNGTHRAVFVSMCGEAVLAEDQEDFEPEELEADLDLGEETDDLHEKDLAGFLALYTELRRTRNAAELLDALQEKIPDRPMNRMELRVVMNMLRKLLQKDVAIRKEVTEHSSWTLLTETFRSVKHEVPLQETTSMLTVVAFLDGHPRELTEDLFSQLEAHLDDIRNAKPWTVRSIVMSMSRLQQYVSVSLVRLIHEKVLKDVDGFSGSDLVQVSGLLLQMEPVPSDGMISVIYDAIQQRLPDLNRKDLIFFCSKMLRMKLVLPSGLLDAVYERCMGFVKDMNAEFLTTFLSWMSSVGYPVSSAFRNDVQPTILALLRSTEGKRLAQLALAYMKLAGTHDSIVLREICDAYLSADNAHSVHVGNWLLCSFRVAEIRDKARITRILDTSSQCLGEASVAELVFLLSLAAQMNIGHPCLEAVVENLSHCPQLTMEQVSRILCSCARLRSVARFKVHPFFSHVAALAKTKELNECSPYLLVLLTDALMKLHYKNTEVGMLFSETFDRHLKSYSLRQRLATTKALLTIGGPRAATKLVTQLGALLSFESQTVGPAEVSHAVETVALAGAAAGSELRRHIVDLISVHYESFNIEELTRVLQYGTRNPQMKPELVDALVKEAASQIDSIAPRDMSLILWGLAKGGRKVDRSLFDHLATGIVENLQTIDIFSLNRYVFACASMSYLFPTEMDAIAERIICSTIEALGIQTIGTYAWSIAKLGYKNEAVLSWLQENMHACNLGRATFCTMSNIMFAFLRFHVEPSESFLSEVLSRTTGNLTNLTPYEFGCISHGLVLFGSDIPGHWLEEAIDYFESNISRFRTHSLSYAVWCLVKLGYRPSKEIMTNCCIRISEECALADMQVLANFIWACGRSRFKPVPLLSGLEMRITQEAESIKPSVAATLVWGIGACRWRNGEALRALGWGSYDRMEMMSAAEFSGFIWGLANCGFYDRKFFLKAANVALEKEEEMTAEDLLLSLCAFARAKQPADVFLQRAMKRLPHDIEAYDSNQLLSLAWTLTNNGVFDLAVMQSFEKAVQSNRDSFNTKKSALILHTFATLGYVPEELDRMLEKIAFATSLATLKTWPLLHTLWACCQFNRRPPRNILMTLQEKVTNEMPNLWKGGQKIDAPSSVSGSQLVLSVWCLYALGLQETSFAIACARRVNEVDVLETLTRTSRSQLAQCLLLCTYTNTHTPLLDIPLHYRETILESLSTEVSIQSAQGPSSFSKDVASGLQFLEQPYQQQVVSSDKNLLLDFVLTHPDTASDRQPVVLHLCHEADTFNNTKGLNGKANFDIRLREAAGFSVIPIMESEWKEAVRHGGSGMQYLWSLLTDHGFDLKDPGSVGQNSTSPRDPATVDPGAWVDHYEDGLEDDASRVDSL